MALLTPRELETEEEKEAFFYLIRQCWRKLQTIDGLRGKDHLLNAIQLELTLTESSEVIGVVRGHQLQPQYRRFLSTSDLLFSIIPAEGVPSICTEVDEEFREMYIMRLSRLDTLSRKFLARQADNMKKEVRHMFHGKEREPDIVFAIDFGSQLLITKCTNYSIVNIEIAFPE